MNFQKQLAILMLLSSGAFNIAIAQPLPSNSVNMAMRKEWTEARRRGEELKLVSPEETVSLYRKFLADRPQIEENLGCDVYFAIAGVQSISLKDAKAALATVEEGLGKYAGATKSSQLASLQARLLQELKRPAEAQAALLKYWPHWMKSAEIGNIALAWRRLIQTMKEQGKVAESQRVLEAAPLSTPILLDDRLGTQAGWLIEELSASALEKGDSAKALSWAKLRFITCSYSDESLAKASQQLAMVWAVKDPKASGLFLTALSDSSQPNPLKDVPLPSMEAPGDLPFEVPQLSEIWDRALPHERITLLLWAGKPSDYSRAMVEAMRLSNNKMWAAQGAQEVCRIFKAADLNLTRAEAYMAYLKTGQGESPVAAFMTANAALIQEENKKVEASK